MSRRQNRRNRRRRRKMFADIRERDIERIGTRGLEGAENYAAAVLMVSSATELATQLGIQTSGMARLESMANVAMSRCVREILGGGYYYPSAPRSTTPFSAANRSEFVESIQREIRDQPVVT